jgi:hypothetical protein
MYPQKLANLDLDLALAPLENNQFNDCKSNLRLLEYGACGYPVICSNTGAFVKSKLPVQIIKNRYKDWMDAINLHIHDVEYRMQQANNLQTEVLNNYMLDKFQIRNWLKNWSS